MKNRYMQHFGTATPQSRPIPEYEGQMVPNRAGGWVFPADDWTRLQRFLILGTDQGSYYATAQELTREAATCIDRLLEDGQGLKVVEEAVRVSQEGRAPRNDPAILTLALCLKTAPDIPTRQAAARAVDLVCRQGSYLASFVVAVEALGKADGEEPRQGSGGGWGPLTRKAIADWISMKTPEQLAFQAIKYRQRQDWRLADWLRLSHPPIRHGATQGFLYDWILEQQASEKSPRHGHHTTPGIPLITAFEEIQQKEKDPARAAALVRHNRLPWEAVPSRFSRDLTVQAALFESMPVGATLRQLGRLTNLGLLTEQGEHTELACARLTNPTQLARARVHPMNIYLALRTYQQGHGDEGKLTWTPLRSIQNALEAAFFLSFKVAPRSQRKLVIGIDCSGSMTTSYVTNPARGRSQTKLPMTTAEAAAVMAYVQDRHNPNALIVAFDTRPEVVSFASAEETLGGVRAAYASWGLGGATDVAQPMLWATRNIPDVDAFVVYTDDETWAGKTMHPVEAVSAYRDYSGKPTKLVVNSFVAHGYRTAGSQDDAGFMHVVGLDEASPRLIDNFLGEPLALPAP